jgi:hypothetical protein
MGFIGIKDLKALFATSNPRKIDGGKTLTAKAVTSIAGTAVELVAASSNRRRVIIQNSNDGTNAGEVVAIGPADVTLAKGLCLSTDTATGGSPPKGDGGVVTLYTQAAVYGIATTNGAVRVLEESD